MLIALTTYNSSPIESTKVLGDVRLEPITMRTFVVVRGPATIAISADTLRTLSSAEIKKLLTGDAK